MKLLLISGMVAAGFAGSMTASNMIVQDEGSTESTRQTTSSLASDASSQDEGRADQAVAGSTGDSLVTQTVTQDGVARTYTRNSQGQLLSVHQQGGLTGKESPESKTRRAMDKLRKAKDDDEREEAEEALREALEAEYDAMLKLHEKQLDQLETRLKSLRDQVRKRRRAKSELVDLKFKMMLHEADGLGWPGRRGPGGYGSFGRYSGFLNNSGTTIGYDPFSPGARQGGPSAFAPSTTTKGSGSSRSRKSTTPDLGKGSSR